MWTENEICSLKCIKGIQTVQSDINHQTYCFIRVLALKFQLNIIEILLFVQIKCKLLNSLF